MASAEEVVSYPVWTLLPNSNSMKVTLKTMWSRTQTPNQIMLQVFYQFYNCEPINKTTTPGIFHRQIL